ncbi:PolC-type DNA polymerase III [Paenibacillus mesophilus]|uniref:PolC-type DNA polymerase III n=1 Tax=Paenibacillus mesophilus TaxID=2582849 RepID=UPI00110E01C3|nr:PolC-type DNA polymerase III [Paenibacillus mesophilus]TMV51583.1 PolC-type DNA polymerase III [Paenibacillus mesophilus]
MKPDKRTAFEKLAARIQLPMSAVEPYVSDTVLDHVEVSRDFRKWTIVLSSGKLIPSGIYRLLHETVCSNTRYADYVDMSVRYPERIDTTAIVNEYWNLCSEWLLRKEAVLQGWMSKAKLSVDHARVHLLVMDRFGAELLEKKQIGALVHKFYYEKFSREVRIGYKIHESSRERYWEDARMKEQAEVAAMTQSARQVQQAEGADLAPKTAKPIRTAIGQPIKEQPLPIRALVEPEKRVTIRGAVFATETKQLKNGSTLMQFFVTDYTDSIAGKVFVKHKVDMELYDKLLQDGNWLLLRGSIQYDTYSPIPELVFYPQDIAETAKPSVRQDTSSEKRVEFHLHTTMSSMDALTPAEAYIETAAAWGHRAIAITDHGSVQSFPEAEKAARKHGIQIIYGVEANVIDDGVSIATSPRKQDLNGATYVVFDVETTGLSVTTCHMIELAAIKMTEGKETGRFTSFVNPRRKIPHHITQLTGISDEMVADAPNLAQVMKEFIRFIGDSVLVAHNAGFDIGFIRQALRESGLPDFDNPVLDTLELARALYPKLKNHRLNTLADLCKVELNNHHRAIDDSVALGHILYRMIRDARAGGTSCLSQINALPRNPAGWRPFHCNIYARSQQGKKVLYKLVSLSHTDYYNKVPCIPKSVLREHREHLLIVSGCDNGEMFDAVLNKSMEDAEQVALFYDVLEVQPPCFYKHLIDKKLVEGERDIETAICNMIRIGSKQNKPVIATGNVHYLEPGQKLCRDIVINGITKYSPLKERAKPDAYLRTTEEMLGEFKFLGAEQAYEIVVKNTRELAGLFQPIQLFPTKGGPTDNGLFSPILEGADEEIRQKCYAEAVRVYGDPLPELVVARLEKELKPIISYGFSANYLISERLVKKSNADGYIVGSRGSVGSSFVATMLGISEVNPLPPHYVCPSCKTSEFFTDGRISSGYDMPDKSCSNCRTKMKCDGHDIPFETFLGFKGDKVPDIDLNFSGDYQPEAHRYTKELFGEKNVFRAGTIGTVAEKSAFGFVKKYMEEHNRSCRTAEMNRLALGCTGVKRSTGQHPGGIVVVPGYIDVEDITPVQYPADDTGSEWRTTHFDYHAFDTNLLKLDILGHDDPTMMRLLQQSTGIDPRDIPMNDTKVMSLFHSTEQLGVTSDQIRSSVATYGLPDIGTRFIRQMLEETRPSTFSDLLQIAGLSHGEGLWLGNAQELIRNGTCTIKTVIGCRDNIMLFLIYRGMGSALAFKITESVRKGKGLTDEWTREMKNVGVPDWYIESCQKIVYMFPRAHAAAYMIAAVRNAYYKLYYPLDYYAAYFTVKASDFDIDLFAKGYEAILAKLTEIEQLSFQASAKQKSMVPILEVALEMTARGFVFQEIQLYRSKAAHFIKDGDSLIPPFAAIPGIGESAANQIECAKEDGPFLSIEDFQKRSKCSKTISEALAGMGCFRGLPETNQLVLF